MTRTRLAPSPTGFLHLGNAWSFMAAYCLARRESGRILFRVEDIDPARSREEYIAAGIQDLHWLGIAWDEGPDSGPHAPYRQSCRLDAYQKVLDDLDQKGLLYPCFCTRKELRSLAGAPHVEDFGAPYPGRCRDLAAKESTRLREGGKPFSLRLRCPSNAVWAFEDMIMGPQAASLGDLGGDFALRRSDGVMAYQLAVVADDIAMDVDLVVRGADILSSTFRQLYLYSLLGHTSPRYAHVPLLRDHEGERLAKRHQSLTISSLRETGIRPPTVWGFLFSLAGLLPEFRLLDPADAPALFDPAALGQDLPCLPEDPLADMQALQRDWMP